MIAVLVLAREHAIPSMLYEQRWMILMIAVLVRVQEHAIHPLILPVQRKMIHIHAVLVRAQEHALTMILHLQSPIKTLTMMLQKKDTQRFTS